MRREGNTADRERTPAVCLKPLLVKVLAISRRARHRLARRVNKVLPTLAAITNEPSMHQVQDQFLTTEVGNLFLLRLAGFIRDHKARLIDIDDHTARLEVGGRTFADWFFGREYVERTCIDLAFVPCEQSSSANPTRQLSVAISVRPAGFASDNFGLLASHFIREVRGYFAATC